MSAAALTVDLVVGRERVGCKGPAAERWLASRGITVPEGANRFVMSAARALTARLATSEFLLESTADSADHALAPIRLALERAEMPSGVYPVLRQDFVLEIAGPAANELFLQTCAVDLRPAARESTEEAGPVILTSMIGVSVVLACRPVAGAPRFTVWSDPSYSHYFHRQLLAIAAELRDEASPGAGQAPASPLRSGGTSP